MRMAAVAAAGCGCGVYENGMLAMSAEGAVDVMGTGMIDDPSTTRTISYRFAGIADIGLDKSIAAMKTDDKSHMVGI